MSQVLVSFIASASKCNERRNRVYDALESHCYSFLVTQMSIAGGVPLEDTIRIWRKLFMLHRLSVLQTIANFVIKVEVEY